MPQEWSKCKDYCFAQLLLVIAPGRSCCYEYLDRSERLRDRTHDLRAAPDPLRANTIPPKGFCMITVTQTVTSYDTRDQSLEQNAKWSRSKHTNIAEINTMY